MNLDSQLLVDHFALIELQEICHKNHTDPIICCDYPECKKILKILQDSSELADE